MKPVAQALGVYEHPKSVVFLSRVLAGARFLVIGCCVVASQPVAGKRQLAQPHNSSQCRTATPSLH